MDDTLHYTSVNHADALVASINRLRCDRQLCDVILIVSDYRIPVHRLVLSACSPYFQNILETSWDFGVKELMLQNVSGEAVQMIIDFCYTSAISINEDNVWMILPIAFTFQLEELINLCCDYITSLIRFETCFQSHTIAVQCQCADLEQLSGNYIQDNFEALVESSCMMELSENSILKYLKLLHDDVLTDDQILQALRCWLQHSLDDRQHHASKIVYQFPHLKQKLSEFLPDGDLMSKEFKEEDLHFASPFPTFNQSDLSDSFYDNSIMASSSPAPKLKSSSVNDSASSPYSGSNSGLTINLADTINDSLSVIICTICGELFEVREDLEHHLAECDDPVLKKKLITMIKEGRDFDMLTDMNESDSSKPFLCPICGKSFGDKKNLGKHVKIHSRDGYTCSICTRKYSTKSNLQGHMRMHSSEKPYTCDFCGKVFTSYCILKVHIKTHTGERPFSCPTCGVSFAKNIHLRRHMQIHTGIKPHICDICQKHFSRSDHLKRHKQSIHAGEKPHDCTICKKEFVRKYELNRHMRLHFTNGEFLDGVPSLYDGNGASTSMDGVDEEYPEDEKPDPAVLSALYKNST